MNLHERVRTFICENFYVPEDLELRDETSLLDSGIADSTGMLEVIAFLEESFTFQVEEDEMLPENLDSVGALVAYVQRKT